eukprot:2491409-Pyramimonas_sp.AAC.2
MAKCINHCKLESLGIGLPTNNIGQALDRRVQACAGVLQIFLEGGDAGVRLRLGLPLPSEGANIDRVAIVSLI